MVHHIHIGRNSLIEFIQYLLVFLLGFRNIESFFLCCCDKYTAVAIQARDVLCFRKIVVYVCNILQRNGLSFRSINNGVRNFVQGNVIPAGFHIQRFRTDINASAGNIGDFTLQCSNNDIQWKVQLSQFVRSQVNAHLFIRQSVNLHILQFGKFFQFILQIFRYFLQTFA
ncbi:hypothetical protein D3C86_1267570 [compost metagenome]